jgi:Rrf2 family protein
MRIPMKVDYGVRALVDLATHYDKNKSATISTAVIALRQQIPEQYLDRILLSLKQAGLVASTRGPHGGHILNKNPYDVTLTMVMNALSDTPTAPVNCILEPDDCNLSAACAQREVWQSVEEAIDGILNTTTIGYMAAQQSQIIANVNLGR